MQRWKSKEEFLEASMKEYISGLEYCSEELEAFTEAIEKTLDGDDDVTGIYPFSDREIKVLERIIKLRKAK